jgi:hypothetical protein
VIRALRVPKHFLVRVCDVLRFHNGKELETGGCCLADLLFHPNALRQKTSARAAASGAASAVLYRCGLIA